MNDLYEQIKSVYADLSTRDKYRDETKLSLFRGFLLFMLAQSYGYDSVDDWINSHFDEDFLKAYNDSLEERQELYKKLAE